MHYSSSISKNTLIFQLLFNHFITEGTRLLEEAFKQSGAESEPGSRKRLSRHHDKAISLAKRQRIASDALFFQRKASNRELLINHLRSSIPFAHEQDILVFLREIGNMSELFSEFNQSPMVMILLELIQFAQNNELELLKTKLFAYYVCSDYLKNRLESSATELLNDFEMEGNDFDFIAFLIQLSAETRYTLDNPELISHNPLILKQILENNTSLHSLILSDNNLTDYSMNQLIFGLQFNHQIQHLGLANNPEINEGWIRLALLIGNNHSLRSINLKDNRIDNKVAIAFAKALTTNQVLTSLNLQSNIIQREGAKAIGHALTSNSALKQLNLKANYLDDEGAIFLANALITNKSLESLNLAFCNLNAISLSAFAQVLNGLNQSLKHLDISQNTLCTGQSIQELATTLAQQSVLTSLNMSNTGLTSHLLSQLSSAISKNIHLQSLHLNSNTLDELGGIAIARMLRESKSLRELSASYTNLGAKSLLPIARQLKNNTRLEILTLGGNPQLFTIPPSFLQFLDALSTNTSLQSLDLSDNRLGSEQIQSIHCSLKANSSFRQINLSKNKLDRQGLEVILDWIRSNQLDSLILDRCDISPSGMMFIAQALAKNTSLKSLSLLGNHYSEAVMDAFHVALIMNSNITELKINETLLTEEQSQVFDNLLKQNREASEKNSSTLLQTGLVTENQDADSIHDESQPSCSF